MLNKTLRANALAGETSPYLLQHADNPVDWRPWGAEALECARREQKPILLSIGYSACHWCHVMAHESFEDEEAAALMNRYFINIKVDREERPDLDKIYQSAQQLLTGRTGGWPLTMFLTPEDQAPFFGGTYFPPEPRHGLPGFKALLTRVHQAYQQEKSALAAQNEALIEALKQSQVIAPAAGTELDGAPIDRCIAALEQSFDPHHGGFGGAPKFPHPGSLELLLSRREVGKSLDMARFTLEKMALGGLYDQLGGGFYRYSVDARWHIPHFEKMLYDNGPLLGLYANAWHVKPCDLFWRVVHETAAWVMREMQAAGGGLFSSLDADSEGEEGKFYAWDPAAARALLTRAEFDVFARRSGLDQPSNFEGRWHLYAAMSAEEIARADGREPAAVEDVLRGAAAKLLQVREQRVRPGRDEKILTSWNALAIKGLTVAARRLHRPDYHQAAVHCLEFVHARLWDGRKLAATCKDEQARLNAYLDDYAFLLDAVLHVLCCQWSGKWLGFALQLADTLLEQFFDEADGGFFFTSHDHERLLQRRKDFMDDSLPSGNGAAALSLLILGHLAGRRDYLDAARKTLEAGRGLLERAPQACTAMAAALLEYTEPRQVIILRGREQTLTQWRRRIEIDLDVRSLVFAVAETEQGLPDLIKEKKPQGPATAFICKGFQCLAPVSDLDELQRLLR